MQNHNPVRLPKIGSLFSNPVSRKRFLRFYSMKRAWFSLVLLVILYCISLCSEFISNNVPLYVRFQGRSYFPIFAYYPEDMFLHNGRMTRPDYKALRRMPVFSENPGNFMIFPPFESGPYESVDANSIDIPDTVTLKLSPLPKVCAIDIERDLTIRRIYGPAFFSKKNEAVTSSLGRFFPIPPGLESAIRRRFENQPSPRFTIKLPGPGSNENISVDVPTFRPRTRPPEKLRVILRQTSGSHPAVSMVFGRDLIPQGTPDIWNSLLPRDRSILLGMVKRRFQKPVDDYLVIVSGNQYRASFIKSDLTFPFHPVSGHPFGLDAAGRDVFARILYGLRISLSFGFLLVIVSMALGTAAGAVQGYYGGRLDITAQRLTEIWSAIPFLYVMILMGSIYGRSFSLLLFCYGLFNWIGISYYIRAEFLKLRKMPFVEAAKCMGVPGRRIIFRHILPNALVPVITFFPFSLVGAIGALAALDYLGFGLPPPTPSWGELLFEAQQYRWAWWLILYPSLALFGVMLLGVFVGEGVRNAYDPRQYTKLE